MSKIKGEKMKKDKKEIIKENLKKETLVFFGGFKAFITRGNVIDLAIAVVIGGAFNKIVSSLVNDIIMPLISTMLNTDSFANLVWNVRGSEIRYGNFIQVIVEFLIIAFSIYVTIEWFLKNQIKRRAKEIALAKLKEGKVEEEKTQEETKENILNPTEQLLTEIRDLLKQQYEETK